MLDFEEVKFEDIEGIGEISGVPLVVSNEFPFETKEENERRELNERKRKVITEEMKLQEQWFKDAEAITMENLSDFLKGLTENYVHDYGTICHAIVAGTVATAKAMNRTPAGGITGFQAGCIMWGFIQEWMHLKNRPLKLLDYSDMLYPQYDYKFGKTISSKTWQWLQEEADKKINENKNENAHPNILQHWLKIKQGELPFGYEVADD